MDAERTRPGRTRVRVVVRRQRTQRTQEQRVGMQRHGTRNAPCCALLAVQKLADQRQRTTRVRRVELAENQRSHPLDEGGARLRAHPSEQTSGDPFAHRIDAGRTGVRAQRLEKDPQSIPLFEIELERQSRLHRVPLGFVETAQLTNGPRGLCDDGAVGIFEKGKNELQRSAVLNASERHRRSPSHARVGVTRGVRQRVAAEAADALVVDDPLAQRMRRVAGGGALGARIVLRL